MKVFYLFVSIIVLFIFSACSSAAMPAPTATAVPPTATPIPPTPWPTPDHSLTAVEKRENSQIQEWAVLELPGMENVTVANIPYKDDLTADFYYPPDFSFEEKLPVVLFVNGVRPSDFKDLKDTGWYVSWGQLVAASNLIGVNYEVKDPNADIHEVITFIQENSDFLRTDAEHICLWSSSGNTPVAMTLLTGSQLPYQEAVSCFVIYYGKTITVKESLPNIPIFIVNAGQDSNAFKYGLEKLAKKAEEDEVPFEYIIYEEGEHGFDIWNDTAESRAIIEQTLAYMKENLQE